MAAGIRRIEARTGTECEELLYNIEDQLKMVRMIFNNAKDLEGVLQKYVEEHDTMKKEIEQFKGQAVERLKQQLIEKAREINGVKVVTAVMPLDPASAKDLVFKVRQEIPQNLLDDMVSEHKLNAGQMVREAAKLIQGGGGGQPHFATAGGKNTDGLSAAVDKVVELANL